MRVALLRHNFAALVWLTAGAHQIGGMLGFRGLLEAESKSLGTGTEEDGNVWRV